MGTLANGLKDIFSTSQTTATHLPVCASDGTPQGRISAADLASVLGATYVSKVASAVDLNTLTTQGKYIVPNNNTNAPTTDYGLVLVEVRNSVIFQWFYRTGGVDCYYRVKNGNSEWLPWSGYAFDIPSFYKNYADLNALTNALVKQNALSIGNVMVVTNVDSYTRFWPADRALESGIASIAVGAGIIENGRTLIIAKDTTTKKWAESQVAGGNSYLGREAAVADFNGRTNTNKILETLGDNAPAATYCHTYHPANVDSADTNMGAGRWWLPSLGEWAMIWAHVREVNFVLAAIGGTQIPVGSGWTWSSTEYSASTAWLLEFRNGGFGTYGKTGERSVRPVSAFY